MAMKTERELIYVALLDEGTSVWRPTQAEKALDGTCLVLPTPQYDLQDETWEFPPGSRVTCEKRRLAGNEVLVAVRSVPASRQTA